MSNPINIPEIPEEALKEVIDSVDKHVGKTYDNLTSEPTKEIGVGISSLINLVFSPIRYGSSKAELYYSYKLKLYEKELEERISSIPEEQHVEPDVQNILIALDNSRYCITDDELRKMFVNLISNSLYSEKSKIVHPSYAEVIKQMNSTDAKILKTFKQKNNQSIDSIYYDFNYANKDDNLKLEYITIEVSINNLVRLGVISPNYKLDYSVFQRIQNEEYEHAVRFSSSYTPHEKIEPTIENYSLSQFGQNFLYVCCPDDPFQPQTN